MFRFKLGREGVSGVGSGDSGGIGVRRHDGSQEIIRGVEVRGGEVGTW
jgi:hypothetical protein